jgi:hypothetical protein
MCKTTEGLPLFSHPSVALGGVRRRLRAESVDYGRVCRVELAVCTVRDSCPAESHARLRKSQNGRQSGDPAKLARALITIASQEPPPRRLIAGADAIATTEQKLADLRSQIAANRDLSTSLAFD